MFHVSCIFMSFNPGCINLMSSLPLGWFHVGSYFVRKGGNGRLTHLKPLFQELPEQAQVKIMEAVGLFGSRERYQFYGGFMSLQPNMEPQKWWFVDVFPSPDIFRLDVSSCVHLLYDLGYWEHLKSHHSATGHATCVSSTSRFRLGVLPPSKRGGYSLVSKHSSERPHFQ